MNWIKCVYLVCDLKWDRIEEKKKLFNIIESVESNNGQLTNLHVNRRDSMFHTLSADVIVCMICATSEKRKSKPGEWINK